LHIMRPVANLYDQRYLFYPERKLKLIIWV
jgi:hypothetical protein